MSEMDRELGWDDVIEKDSNFVTLPEGDYDFVIDHFERARHPGSDKIPPCNKALVFFRLMGPDGQELYLIHISEPTRPRWISYAVFCLIRSINIR